MPHMKIPGLIAAGILVLAIVATPFSRKKKDDITQVLELPKDSPFGVIAETRRLMFYTAPLSSKGLLSAQTRDAIRALLRENNGSPIVKIRAFVAGSGDMRRVPAIVSEIFTERRMALPAVSVVQSGGLPVEGAQVALESISLAKRDVNSQGLLFISGQAASVPEPLQPTVPLAQQALTKLRAALASAGAVPNDVLRVTCFLSALDRVIEITPMVSSVYQHAALDFVQTQRATPMSVVECEAVARLPRAISMPVEFLNPPAAGPAATYSQVAAVGAQKIALTGTQVAFGFEDDNARLAFQRLQKELEMLGSSTKDVAMASIYPLSSSIADQVRKIRFEFFDPARPPASTLLPFEGLPSVDASFALDVVAVVNK